MRNVLKKTVLALIAALVFALPAASVLPSIPIVTAVTVFAVPGDDNNAEGETVPTPIQASVGTQAANNQDPSADRSGVGIGTVIILVLLGVVISAVISFIVSNRFYKMSKRDGHLQAEIRALRRDIDDKFSGRVTELHERSVSVKNTNKSYARSEGDIAYKETPSKAVEEIEKRWNIKIEDDTEPHMRDKSRPVSERTSGRNTEKNRQIQADPGVSDGVKNKAKKFLGDIFPFEED